MVRSLKKISFNSKRWLSKNWIDRHWWRQRRQCREKEKEIKRALIVGVKHWHEYKACYSYLPTLPDFLVFYRKTPPATGILKNTAISTGFSGTKEKPFFCLLPTKRTSATCFSESYDGSTTSAKSDSAVMLHARPTQHTLPVPPHHDRSGRAWLHAKHAYAHARMCTRPHMVNRL